MQGFVPSLMVNFLRLPKKLLQVGRNISLFAVLNFGKASQLRPNKHPLLIFLNVFYDGLGVSGGQVAGALVAPVLSVGWAVTEICF